MTLLRLPNIVLLAVLALLAPLVPVRARLATHPQSAFLPQQEPGHVRSLSFATNDPEVNVTEHDALLGWTITCVDCPKSFDLHNRSLQLDSADRPHVAYGGDHLYYAWHDGVSWHYQTVDDSPGVGHYTSLALDGTGYAHISYHNSTSGDLKYAYQNSSGWHTLTVDSVGSVGQHTSLAIDQEGYPHISYYDQSYTDLKYAYQDNTGWHFETVDSTGDVGKDTSLIVDGADCAHVSYVDQTNHNLKYAYKDGSGWHMETVDTVGWSGSNTSLTLDKDGNQHITYYDGDLRYARNDGTTWHIETVDDYGEVGLYSSLVLDGDGRPHISYYDDRYVNGDLKYASHDGTSWQIETVDSEGWVGLGTSLALDGAYRPHIIYFDVTNSVLKHTHHNGTAWQITMVDSSRDIGRFSSLALNAADHPSISYYDLSNGALKYAHFNGTTWAIETVDNSGNDVGGGGSISLVMDSAGRPHISYFCRNNADLKYAYFDGTFWRIETVESDGWVGSYISLELDAANRPHISYYDWTDGEVKYAHHNGTAWLIEVVDWVGEYGDYTSLALDTAGRPHVTYTYPYTGHGLEYAYRDEFGWHIETVTSNGSATSLALDADGYPHISYSGSSGLEYAYRDESEWRIVTVDGLLPSETSLALDGAGFAHIGYATRNFQGEYAYYNGTSWQVEPVDGGGGHEVSSWSLALDSAGGPHISYYDSTTGDLKYTRREPPLMPPATPTLYAISNSDGDNSFIVDWNDVEGAASYTLQEDDNAYFTSPVSRYSGSASEYLIVNQLAGSWYYRTRASNGAGDSPWSNTESTVIDPPTGDSFEIDDTCVQAPPIVTEGTVQHHTFHDQGDLDWVTFYADAGVTYILQGSNVGAQVDLVSEFYDTCDTPALPGDDLDLGHGFRLVWTCPASGEYYLKVSSSDPGLYGEEAIYDLSVRRQTSDGVAIVVAGRRGSPESLMPNFTYSANAAYRVFRFGGFTPDRIYYLHPNTATDADGDGSPDVDAVSNSSNLQQAITTWAGARVGPSTPFYLYMVDHGAHDLYYADGWTGTVTAAQLRSWLTQLETQTGCDQVNVIIETCESGSFLIPPEQLSRSGRVVISSAQAGQAAYGPGDGQGAYFSNSFLAQLGAGADLWTAFNAARDALWEMRGQLNYQQPWLDDNGDGVADEQDGAEARQRGLLASFGSAVPWIAAVSLAQEVDGYTAVITATIYDDGPLAEVWAEVYPPWYAPPNDSSAVQVVDVPQARLTQTAPNHYRASYGGFTARGEYRVIVHSRDLDGNHSLPRGTVVRTGYAVYLPTVLRRP